MNKNRITFLSLLLCLVLLTIGISATETATVSLSEAGSLAEALAALQSGGTLVIDEAVTVTENLAIPETAGNLTVTSVNGAVLTLAADIVLAKNTNANTVTLDLPVAIADDTDRRIFGGFNSVTFGENFTVTSQGAGMLNFYGGVNSQTDEGITTLPYDITVYNGTFDVFVGGNWRETITAYLGSIAAELNITVEGGTFGDPDGVYPYGSNNKNYDTFSISGMSILADDARLTVNGGTFYCPIYAQGRTDTITSTTSDNSETTASDRKYYAIDGDIFIDINGGTFHGGAIGAYYTQAAYTQVMRGDYTVTVAGGTFTKETVVDATQVKAYAGSDAVAWLIVDEGVTNIKPVRFDVIGEEAQEVEEPLRVAFIGDSITEGYVTAKAGVSRLFDGYPARFLAAAEADGREVIVSNYGIGSAGMLPSLGRYYYNMLAWPMVYEETDADYVFMALGTNDSVGAGGTHGGQLIFEEKYTDILTKMGNLPTTEKVFITNSIYRLTNSLAGDIRNSAVIHPLQKRVATALAKKDADKYIFVDLYGLTLANAKDDTLFTANDGNLYERLHPAQPGLNAMGVACYNAVFNGKTAPENYKKTEIYLSDSGTKFGAGTEAEPISFVPYALDLIETGSEVTLYIKGTLTCAAEIFFPLDVKKINVVGVGTDAKLVMGTSGLKFGCPVKFDNLTLSASGSNILCWYNDVEFTESVTTEGVWAFTAGYNVFSDADPTTTAAFDTVATASSDKDCTIKLAGGSFTNFVLGNRRLESAAPFGVYSGTMTATIGENVKVNKNGNAQYVGLVGHNYLTGTVHAEIAAWSGDIKTYSAHGSLAGGIKHRPLQNTGKVNVTLAEGMTAKIVYPLDFTGEGEITVEDALLALRYVLDGSPAGVTAYNYGNKIDSLTDVLLILNAARQ